MGCTASHISRGVPSTGRYFQLEKYVPFLGQSGFSGSAPIPHRYFSACPVSPAYPSHLVSCFLSFSGSCISSSTPPPADRPAVWLSPWDLVIPPPRPASQWGWSCSLLIILVTSLSPLGFLALLSPVLNSCSKSQGKDSVFMDVKLYT